MAQFLHKKLLSIFFISCVLFSHHSSGQLDDSKSCSDYCHVKYGLLEFKADSCARGCRFYTISRYLTPRNIQADKDDFALNTCFKSCGEAYAEEADEFSSCEEGCQKQNRLTVEPVVRDESGAEEDSSEEQSIHLATPVLQVRKVVAQVLGSFHIIKTYFTTYFLQDDNTLLAVQSQPQIIVDVAPEKGFESPEEALEAVEDNQLQGRANFNFGSKALESEAGAEQQGSGGVVVTRVSSSGAHRYAYLLHLLLLLAVVSLSLLALSYCLGMARQQQRKTLKAANLTVALQQEPLKLVRPEDLTKLSLMEEEEAPRLPSKQDLALTHANI